MARQAKTASKISKSTAPEKVASKRSAAKKPAVSTKTLARKPATEKKSTAKPAVAKKPAVSKSTAKKTASAKKSAAATAPKKPATKKPSKAKSEIKLSAVLDRILTLEIVRVTERAAVAAARQRGRGDEKAADQAAVDAMRRELNRLPIRGTVVIGEGERDEAPMLYIGEEVGIGDGPVVDIALDPLEGTTICAKDLPNSLAVIAIAEGGSLLNAPDVYMDKIAIGPGYPAGIVSIDASPAENIKAIAKAKGVPVGEVTACILDRPRHAAMIEDVRAVGAGIRLIGDGDIAGVIHTTDPDETGIDIYMGIGGAPEGVLAAAALRCIGGQMQGRLILDTDEKRSRASKMGITDFERVYAMEEMARGDVLFAATGVTDGNLLSGVRFCKKKIMTETVVMRSLTQTVRWIKAEHTMLSKFG